MLNILNNLPFGDVATWFTGLATFGALVVAFIQINNERKIRKSQERRSQAEHISAYIAKEEDYKAQIAILNLSTEPVYEVIVSIVAFQGANPGPKHIASLSVVPPGKAHVVTEADYHGMSFHPSIEIAFKDVRGKSWVLSGRCYLTEISQSHVDYYKLSRPLGWQLPEQE